MFRLKGDFQLNKAVLKHGKGELLVVRRCPEEEFDSAHFSPCPCCLGYYKLDHNMQRHFTKCPAYDVKPGGKKDHLLQSRLLSGLLITHPKLLAPVLCIIKMDGVGLVVQKAPLIHSLGMIWLSKCYENSSSSRY